MKTLLQILIALLSIHLTAQPLSGSITIGSGGDYPNFTSNTGLFKAINDNGLNGNITATIISDITELASVSLNEWTEFPSNANYTLNIVSNNDTEKTILSNAGSHVFRFNGADRITIDGSINGTGSYLNFVGWTQSVFFFSNGATNNQLKNIKISCRYATSGSVIFAASGNSNNLVENCEIFNRPSGTNYPKHGIHSYHITNSNNSFINNKIYGFLEAGIYIESGDNVLIEGNEIYSDVGQYGIHCKNLNAITINANKIYNLFGITTPQNITGIRFNHGEGINPIVNITNNMISLNQPIPGNISGLSLDGTVNTTITVNAFHNTILISGTEDSSWSANGVRQIDIDILNFKNNIVINTRENTNTTGNLANNRCVSFNNVNTTIINSDNNLLYNSGLNTYIGQWNSTLASSLTDWQNLTGFDMNSVSKNVTFVSETDLHLIGTSLGDSDLSVPLLGLVTTDFDFETRAANTYMGCDEVPNTLTDTEYVLSPNFSVYPNPASDIIHIKTIDNGSNLSIKIFNSLGALVKETHSTREVKINNLQPGLYFMNITHNNKQVVKKFIKQ
jgi:hypothetical protein